MRISLVTPAATRARNGNRNTAGRWARFLREFGHQVRVEQHWKGTDVDIMIALHARRSCDSIRRYSEQYPGRPLVVVLTGTDIYRDIQSDADAKSSLELATRLVVLQDRALLELTPELVQKTHVIYQSSRSVPRPPPLSRFFEVVVSGHLRTEKDPFRTAAALAHLPRSSRICVTHIGGALAPEMETEARAWMDREPRYRWLGEVPHWRAMRLLARARLMVISSVMEGGANVVSEALCLGVPVVASRISGNVGMLGSRYPGYYALGDERALAHVLSRAERDEEYYRRLEAASAARATLVTPESERAAVQKLISSLAVSHRQTRRATRLSVAQGPAQLKTSSR